MTNNKGITLIALVITIIVLLILAGVSIAMLTGQNGVLKRANDASDDSKRAEIADKVNMAIQSAYTDAVVANTTTPAIQSTKLTDIYASDNTGETLAITEGTLGTDKEVTATVTVTKDSKTYTVKLTKSGNSYTTKADDVKLPGEEEN